MQFSYSGYNPGQQVPFTVGQKPITNYYFELTTMAITIDIHDSWLPAGMNIQTLALLYGAFH